MCRAVAVTFRDSLCDTFNVSNEYESLLRPGDLLAPRDWGPPRTPGLPPWHYTFCQHLNMGREMIETTSSTAESSVAGAGETVCMNVGRRAEAGH